MILPELQQAMDEYKKAIEEFAAVAIRIIERNS